MADGAGSTEPTTSRLVAELHDRLIAVTSSADVTLSSLRAWAGGLSDEQRLALDVDSRRDGRAAIAHAAIDVFLSVEADDMSIEDATGYRTLLEGPPPPLGPATALTTVAEPPRSLAARLGLAVVRFPIEGISLQAGIVFPDPTAKWWFSSAWSLDEEPAETRIDVRPEFDRAAATGALFEAAAVDEEDLSWLHPDVDTAPLPRWALERLDDNGNRFVVRVSRSRAKLERIERTMDKGGHKQTYAVVPAGD